MIKNIPGTNLRSSSDTIFLGLLALIAGIGLGLAVLWVENPLYLAVPIVGSLVLLLVLRDIEIGLLTLVFLTYTRISDVLINQHGLASVAKFFVPFLFGVLLLRWWVYKERPGGWGKAIFLFGIYGMVLTVSSFYAVDPGLTLAGVVDYIKDILIALLVIALLKDGKTFRRIVWSLLAAGIFLGTLTTIQVLTGTYDQTYGGFAQASISHIVGQVNDYRVQGPLSTNYFALIMVFLVPLAMDRFWQEKSKWLRLLAGWALTVIVISILFTFSRGGFLALMVVAGLMLLRHPPKVSVMVSTLFVALLFIPLMPGRYSQRIATLLNLVPSQDGLQLNDGALRGRLSELTVSGLMFLDHPIGGVGFDNFELHYLEYSPALALDSRREGRAAHNLYAEVAAETGLVGLAAFGLILYAVLRGLRRAYRMYQESGLTDYADMTLAFGVGLLGFLVGSLFLHGAYHRYLWLILGIGIALPGAARLDLSRINGKASGSSK